MKECEFRKGFQEIGKIGVNNIKFNGDNVCYTF
jgi:hypothetical protein